MVTGRAVNDGSVGAPTDADVAAWRARLEQPLAEVRADIAEACAACHRDPADVTLIAVAKRQPAAAISAVHALGVRDIGENYVQELAEKAEALTHLRDLRFHHIGQLQRNKVGPVLRHARVLHSIDSERLAARVETVAAGMGRRIPVFVQVNLNQEDSKGGVGPEGLAALVAYVRGCDHLDLRGLMTLPEADEAGAQRAFAACREHAVQLGLSELSMGMSGDFAAAIAEGATHIRVGTRLFGARPAAGG